MIASSYLTAASNAVAANIFPVHATTEPDRPGCQGTLSDIKRQEAYELAKLL